MAIWKLTVSYDNDQALGPAFNSAIIRSNYVDEHFKY